MLFIYMYHQNIDFKSEATTIVHLIMDFATIQNVHFSRSQRKFTLSQNVCNSLSQALRVSGLRCAIIPGA